MARCCLTLLALAGLALLAASSPVPRPKGPAGPASAAPRSPLDLLDDHTRTLAPDMADPLPPARHRASPRAAALRNAAVKAASSDPYRLPTSLIPILYQVTMHPQVDKGIFYGATDIYLNVNKATNVIKLHASNDLNIPSVEIFRYNPDFGKYYGYGEAKLMRATAEGLRRITLSQALEPGKHYMIRFQNFAGRLRDDLKGFYLSSYKDASGNTVRLATTQFEPPAARYAFPCFDEPSFKARFKIIIETDLSLYPRSNMPAIRQTMPDLATLRTEFDETLPMSTYLLAWVVSDYSFVANDDNDFLTFGRSNALTEDSAYLSQMVGPEALLKLRDFTGLAYALPKVDQFAIPDFDAGAMENWGLVTYREEYLLETSRTPIRIREFIATTVCHELGHQWTGNLVTLDWWSNTWLNEAFATYFENVICDQIIPEWKLMDKYVTDNVHVGIDHDVVLNQVAMSSPVSTIKEIEDKFDRITYKKGGAVLRMFEHVLGTDVWKKALHRYLSVNAFRNGSPDRLFKAIDAEAKSAGSPLPTTPEKVSFATVAKTWTEQAGVPVLTATRLYTKGAVAFSQQQLYYEKPSDTDFTGNSWYIPIPEPINPKTNKTDNKWGWSLKPVAETKRWLAPGVTNMQMDVDAAASEWLLINPNQIGYYLVNYDVTNWKLLLDALKSTPAAFDASTRTQLIHDALALARAGLLDYNVALPFLEVLRTEREAAPWRAGIEALTFLAGSLTTTDAGYALQVGADPP
ncbi:hypothetical protein ONE63_007477 [Megalurothrips usitatus]|uniref:Aminopeptidase n=1 Tax=Megalurothrips usitatus TaxID=439358 RepID=A0AAV7XUR9_9NEOP|nr:hypothetical protein ONE63_007477 [Megalurothrips usitatus]